VTTIIRMTAWLLLLAVAVLSLAPPWYRPVTDIPHALEHFVIFLAAGLALGLGYSARYLSQLIPLTSYIAAVEIAQLWVPGRHARFSDFLIDALGASVGLALAQVWRCREVSVP
jgi:VanZ family protein